MRNLCCFFLFAVAAGEETFKVTFAVENLKDGGSGQFVVEVHPEWAPKGAKRFAELVKEKFFDNVRFFRVIDGFMAQFGISGDPEVAATWREKKITDDKTNAKNKRSRLTFATAGPNTRTTQIFINFNDNQFLDNQGFAPFAEVVEGMDIVDKLYSGYGEGAPNGNGPDQGEVQSKGNAYLQDKFPKLSFIKSVTASSDLGAISAAAVAPDHNDVPAVSEHGHGLIIFGVLGFVMLVMGFSVARSSQWRGPPSSQGLKYAAEEEDVEEMEMSAQENTVSGRKRSVPPE